MTSLPMLYQILHLIAFLVFLQKMNLKLKKKKKLMGDLNTPGLTRNAGCPYQIFIIILSLQ